MKQRFILVIILLLGAVAAFAAYRLIPAELTITWTTENEIDNIGFNLYRSDSPDGEFVKINDELIPPADDPFVGAQHEFVDDKDIVRGRTYYYILESVDRFGEIEREGPIEVPSR